MALRSSRFSGNILFRSPERSSFRARSTHRPKMPVAVSRVMLLQDAKASVALRETARGWRVVGCGACNHPNCLVLPFSFNLIRSAA